MPISETKPFLEISNLGVAYGLMPVLQSISASLKPDESIAVLGRNGSGKSTLLKAIYGISEVQVTSGRITFQGVDVTHTLPRERLRRGMVYLPQGTDVFPRLTVEENLLIFEEELICLGIQTQLAGAYRLFPFLGNKRRQLAGNLSGGERRLLALTRAFLSQPSLVLLDEPSAGLSPAATEDLVWQVKRLMEMGTRVILVEQDVALAEQLAMRCVVLDGGHIAFDFPASDFDHWRERLLGLVSLV